MSDRRLRVLVVASHPVQYSSPIFRLLAQHPQLDFQVAYCSLRGAEPGHDPEFGREVHWDVPLLDGYSWTHIPTRGSGDESFFGLYNPGLWQLIRDGRFDAVLCFTGYLCASFWISYLAARSRRVPFLFGTDASALESRDGKKWKVAAKRIYWPILFNLSSQVLTASTAGEEMMHRVGIPADRVSMTLDTVDNDWWAAQAQRLDRGTARDALGLHSQDYVVLFCGKLLDWKRPLDVLQAFANASIPHSSLLVVGDGALKAKLQNEAISLGIAERVRFLGFVNQSALPAVYRASDVLVISSEYEPFGLVVNEAMLCDCVVIASDTVGAVRDLVIPGETGLVYRCGDVGQLATYIKSIFEDPARASAIRVTASQRIRNWSPQLSAAAWVDAVARAIARSGRPVSAPVGHSGPVFSARPRD